MLQVASTFIVHYEDFQLNYNAMAAASTHLIPITHFMQIFSFLILLFGNDDCDADSEVSVSSVEFILPNTNNTLNDFSENCFSKALVSLLRDYDNEFSPQFQANLTLYISTSCLKCLPLLMTTVVRFDFVPTLGISRFCFLLEECLMCPVQCRVLSLLVS